VDDKIGYTNAYSTIIKLFFLHT